MTSKEYMQQVRKIDILIKRKQDELETLESKVRIQGISFENDGSSSPTRNVKKNEELMIKIIMLKDEINKNIILLVDKKLEIMNVIDSLDNSDEINLLYMRYFKFMKWEEIAIEMHYSYKHIHRIHGNALKNVNERIEEIKVIENGI